MRQTAISWWHSTILTTAAGGLSTPISDKTIERVAYELILKAAITLPTDIKKALQEAYERETSENSKAQIKTILENISIAEKHKLPVCQDTGVPLFYIRLGPAVRVEGDIRKAVSEATRKATKEIPLRENVIHPLTGENSGTNTGWGMPYVHFEIEPELDYLEITFIPKGYGSEAKTTLVYIATSEPVVEGIEKCVLDNVRFAMGEPCPPYIVGIGLGGTADIATWLSKKAYLRPLGTHHPDPNVAALESRLLDAINKTGIGAMAMGGDTTALAVQIEICGTHSAAVPVALSFQCWAARQSTARIYDDSRTEYVASHR
jgi:fumarate hydratase subunit alpha